MRTMEKRVGNIPYSASDDDIVPIIMPATAGMYDVVAYDKITLMRVNIFAEKIIASVFNLHAIEAAAHAANLCFDGEEIVLTAPKEIAEQKAQEANAEMQKAKWFARPFLRTIRFEAQPATYDL